jgi:hypothetical protein
LKDDLKTASKIWLYGCVFFVGFCLLAPVSFRLWTKYAYQLPSEKRVRQQFEYNRADYLQFVALLQKDQSAHFVDVDGRVGAGQAHSRFVPEYRDLIRKIGAKDVIVRQDSSIEFSLYGIGCAICSDSYMGVRYVPRGRETDAATEWKQNIVPSLDSAKLPQEHGAVATGLYVVPIEPEWFVYRLEYQE